MGAAAGAFAVSRKLSDVKSRPPSSCNFPQCFSGGALTVATYFRQNLAGLRGGKTRLPVGAACFLAFLRGEGGGGSAHNGSRDFKCACRLPRSNPHASHALFRPPRRRRFPLNIRLSQISCRPRPRLPAFSASPSVGVTQRWGRACAASYSWLTCVSPPPHPP